MVEGKTQREKEKETGDKVRTEAAGEQRDNSETILYYTGDRKDGGNQVM